jgi:multiple sugar transport system substrate-binding protein
MQRKSTVARPLFSLPWAALLLAVTAGCSGTSATTPQANPRPFDGASLKVACRDEPSKRLVERFGRDWATRQGVRLEAVIYDPQTGPEAVDGADVWLIAPASLGLWAEADRLAPLPDEYTRARPEAGEEGRTKLDWPGLMPLYRERLLRWGGHVCALPVLGEAPLYFYRLDLFADPVHKASFQKRYQHELAPPTTWEEFAEVAEFFNALPETSPSLPPLMGDDELDGAFHAIAASCAVRAADVLKLPENRDARAELFSFDCDFATGEPRIASPGFVHALALLRRLQACRAPGDGKPGPEAFAAGKAVMCLADASWVFRFQKSAARPRFGVRRLPGSQVVFDYATGEMKSIRGGNYVPYLGAGGCLGVVPRSAAHAEAAFALLAGLSGPETSRQIVIEPEWGGGVFRRDQLSDAAGWSSFGLDQAQTTSLLQALQQTLTPPGLANPATRLRLPKEAEYRKALLDEVRAALAGKKSEAAALEAAAKHWRELDPPERRRIEYAYSLGLTPP